MNTLELFSGTASFSKVARERGHKTLTIDNDSEFKPDVCMDILDIAGWIVTPTARWKDTGHDIDILWASPPCQGFSVASIGKMWNKDYTPKHPTAEMGLRLLNKTLGIIEDLEPRFWFIENPRGMMRKMPVLKREARTTVTYCQYGDNRMKPTDIWHNLIGWQGKSCKNGMRCHESAPRGSRKGTQGIDGARDRGRIPPALFHEIFDIIENGKSEIKGK